MDDKLDPVTRARHFWDEEGLAGGKGYELMSSIYRVSQAMLSEIDQVLKPFNLNPTNYFALVALSMRGERGLPIGVLARDIKVHQTTATMVLDQLEKQSLVKRERQSRDRRVVLAIITPAGLDIARRAGNALAEINFGLPELAETKRRRVVEILQEVRRAHGDIPTS